MEDPPLFTLGQGYHKAVGNFYAADANALTMRE
jgi:hypothetical protein